MGCGSDTGVIFISIDDNEHAQLKVLCDEIFGNDNFLIDFIWNKKNVVQNDAKFASVNHEYVLSFRKTYQREKFNLLNRTEEANARYDNPDNDPRGVWTSVALQAKSGSKTGIYEITFPNGVTWKPVDGTFPRLNQDALLRAFSDGRIWFGKKGNNVPRLKKYLSEVQQGMVSNSIYLNEDVGSTQIAKELLKRIVGNNLFDTPKPVGLISRLITLSTDKNSLVLDFFAGSGTTGHAVLELNKEDGGNRQFILCTNNENKIAEEVTYPRIRNVIKGYTDVEGIPANLRYYRTDFISNDKSIDDLRHKFILRCSEMLQIRESCFDVSALNGDEYFQVFEDKDLVLAILYHPYEIKRLREIIPQTEKPIVAYIFSMGMEIFQEELAEYGDKVRIETVPDEILETYKKIFGF